MSFFNKNKERMMVTAVAIILIVMIGITSTERMALNKFEKLVGNILTPIGKISNSIGKNISDFFGNLKNIAKLKEENESLKKQIAQLEEENRNYLEIIGRTDYLKNEAKLLDKTSFNLISAQIAGKEPGNWFDRFTIDKGLKDGIKKGSTVVQGIEIEQNTVIEGIVGRVVDVGPNWSKVVTVVDEISSISFKVLRTQDGGIMSGSIDGEISGYLFDNKADIIKGDKLFTSGLGGAFVKDIYIGEVDEVVSDDEDLMKKIRVKPAINFKKIYKVFVISD
ncbi:rod shape-determining protein MreC [Tissierella sp. P1]|jgi:rod shape-determining protein MreC|uniref:rod shape-determining protein MreC n=1 Tax=Tissierella TaxID=41273 RepID=UPI000BA0C221|nr:rod shape-determining protein MreC [Tissierella sp. P1]MDU5080625.1 rod shape-determining protein MreC [Bacillota bacterium]OZV13575.1 rod shape-determining protein MreC [Tissierella sp. P1]